jgi:hypothetical protein
MAAGRTTQTVHIEGLKEVLRACNKLGKDANKELRKSAKEIAARTADEGKARAMGLGGVQRLAAESVKATSDRVPSITMGGSRGLGHRKTPAGSIFFGAEFGGGMRPTTRQFPPHLGQHGYFIWPTIRARKDRDLALYSRALVNVCDRWG